MSIERFPIWFEFGTGDNGGNGTVDIADTEGDVMIRVPQANLGYLDVLSRETHDAAGYDTRFETLKYRGPNFLRYQPEDVRIALSYRWRRRVRPALQEFTNKWLGIPFKRAA